MTQSVTDIMQPCQVFITEDDSVADAALKMLSCKRRSLLVVDGAGTAIGILHASDLAGIEGHEVREGIRDRPVVVEPGVSSLEVVRLMLERGSDYAVVQEQGRLLGEVTWERVKQLLARS